MSKITRTGNENDCSGELFDAIIRIEGLKNDAALARLLDLAPPVVSKIRHGRLAVGPALILKVHEELGMPVREIRDLIGVVA